jgi:hypothetical protein
VSPSPGAEGSAARTVGAHLEATVVGSSTLALMVAVAETYQRIETLRVTLDGSPVPATEVVVEHGGRVHLLRDVGDGRLVSTTRPASRAPPRSSTVTIPSGSGRSARAATASPTGSVRSPGPSSPGRPAGTCSKRWPNG